MGKIKDIVIKGQEFAQDYYNISRDDFIKLALAEFGSTSSLPFSAAIVEYELIQEEIYENFWDF